MPTKRRAPSKLNRAAETISAYEPIAERLVMDTPFDYEAEGAPNPAQAYIDSLESDDSKKNQRYALDIFAAFISGGELDRDHLPWHTLTAEHRDAVRQHLVERYEEKRTRGRRRANPVSVNNRLSAWRQVLWHAWDKGLMSAEDQKRVANVRSATGERHKKRRFVPEESLARVFQSCATDPNQVAGARDAALMALYFGCGLRRFEAIQLILEDLEMREDGWLVTVLGKRNKERTVGIPIGAAAFIRDWLDHRGAEPGPLFYPVRKNGVMVVQEQPMSTRVGNNIVDRRLRQAGVSKFSPHDLRATSTTILAGLLTVFQTMEWAGHDSAETTKGYVVEANDLAHEIAEKLNVPHFRKAGEDRVLSWADLRSSPRDDV